MNQHYKENTLYEILTPTGWEDFEGIIMNEHANKTGKHIKFYNGAEIIATDEHRFYVDGVETKTIELVIGMCLDGEYSNIIQTIDDITLEDTYDIFNAEHHVIVVNGVNSHQCDEFAFVKPHISREFYDSILPTISTGGSMIISSTPNGDVGQYAALWRGANAGLNDFQYGITFVPWDAPPGRDEEFKKKFKGLLGDRKWRQEYECVGGDTLVTVKNVHTGKIEKIAISELDMRLSINANSYQILTESGFKDFHTITSKLVEKYLKIFFDNGASIDCTESHRFKVRDGFCEASNLVIGDVVSPNNIGVIKIVQVDEPLVVYDAVNVDGGNHYITNEITSHNCEFLTEELTLIDSEYVTRAEVSVTERVESDSLIKFAVNSGRFQFFEFLNKGSAYMVAVDPSSGGGGDNGVIQVFEFPSMKQVLEYSNNTLSPQVLYTELKAILKFLEQATDEVYFTVENNGVGQGVLASYEGDMNPPAAMLVSEKGKVGFVTTSKSKMRACLQFKDLFERGKLTISSPELLTELKSFIRVAGGTYGAQVGRTDDRIMACVIMFYMIQEISGNNPSAYDMVYTVAAEIEKRHGWEIDTETVEAAKLAAPHGVMPPENNTPVEVGGRSDYLNRYFANLRN